MNIKGQNSGKQVAAALLTGLVVGLAAAASHVQTHPETIGFLKDSSPVLYAIVISGIVSLVNWYRGKSVDEIVDSIMGEDDATRGDS